MAKYEIYLTFSNRLHLQSWIFISDIVRFGRREAEESENEARKKVLLHT